jgi:hypothetical protein
VHVAIAPELKPVIATVGGIDHIYVGGEKLPRVDYYAPIASLPHIFRTNLENVPAKVPYVSAEPGRVARWRERFAGDKGVKVGIVWAGTPLHQNDRARSCKLADFASLGAVADVSWYSMQKGPGAAQLREPKKGVIPNFSSEENRNDPFLERITALGDDLNDFGDTAALLECLDLLISVDTSPVHLAGALARPVWMVVARGPDWRWMLDRDDSPWYPTLRIFRQTTSGVWADVFERVQGALKHFVSQRMGAKEERT